MSIVVRVTDDADRATIAEAIKALRFKQERMPRVWVERRAHVEAEIDKLVGMWLDAKA